MDVVMKVTVRNCAWCGKQYTARWNYAKERWTQTCSPKCANTMTAAKKKEKPDA